MATIFDHEKLTAYNASIKFIIWIHDLMKTLPQNLPVYNQLDKCATAIALNIAEGNGKNSNKDRCHYFNIARGSALESAAALDILLAKGLINQEETLNGKMMLKELVSMLIVLVKNISGKKDWGKCGELWG